MLNYILQYMVFMNALDISHCVFLIRNQLSPLPSKVRKAELLEEEQEKKSRSRNQAREDEIRKRMTARCPDQFRRKSERDM